MRQFSLNDPEGYDIICKRRAPAEAACGRAAQAALSGSKRPSEVRTQDQRHVGFTPRDGQVG